VILVDSSVWVDHLRSGDEILGRLLADGRVLAHPFVIGELALGALRRRDLILEALGDLPQASVATNQEVLGFIGGQKLHGLGVGHVDAHLLASAKLTAGVALWTRDKRLHAVAVRLGLAAFS
jgi:predicted nucleic acid-binding protein